MVSRLGRGSTRPGRTAPLPEGGYRPVPAVAAGRTGAPVVQFCGEDQRVRTFDFAQVPLPGWHDELAAAFAARVGPAGGLRTSTSTLGSWGELRIFMRFLATLADLAPARPVDLRLWHVEKFVAARVDRLGYAYGCRAADTVWRILRLGPLAAVIDIDVLNAFRRRGPGPRSAKPGYSDGELHRIVAAAKADVGAAIQRLAEARAILDQLEQRPSELVGAQYDRALRLAEVARGFVNPPGARTPQWFAARRDLAQQVFVTRSDVAAMLVLLVAVTGRNVESMKELPAEHRLLENAAVELRLTKRRRGSGNWYDTVTWQIGPRGRELDHPGGLYLLLHKAMELGRARSTDRASFWAVWRNLNRTPDSARVELGNPFSAALTAGIEATAWAREHQLLADDGSPLVMNFNRLRTSIEVRRTRKMGGHLPSAARSNTMGVLFSNYLRGDPTTTEWAQEITATAIDDAERSALAAHRASTASAGLITVLAQREGSVGEDGPWTSCRDTTSHPETGRPCRSTFLDCFHCGNCVVTSDHLPRLLSLLAALRQRRGQLADQEWWARYGPVWAAIRHDILPRFTAGQVEAAQRVEVTDALLDLVEEPWALP